MPAIVTTPVTGTFEKSLCLNADVQQTLRTLQLDEGCSPGRGQKVGNTVFSARTSFSTGGLYNLFAILPTEEGNKDSNDQRSASLPSSSHFQSLMGASSQKKGCAFCGVLNALNGGPLVRCQHCNMVAYCGEEHQKFDWKRHKPLCKTVQSQLSRNANSIVNHSTDVRFHLFTPNSPPRTYLSPDSPAKGTGGECASTSCSSSPSLCDDSPKWAIRANMNSSSALATVPSASPDCVLRCRVDSRSDMQSPHRLVDTSDPDIQIIESRCSTRPQRVTRKRPQNQLEMRPVKDHSLNVAYQTTLQEHLKTFASSGIAFNQHQAVALRLMTIAEHVIRGLNEYGWALVDNFLGLAHCHHLYQEMEKLYLRGLFSAGQLMANKFGSHSQDIRSDEIYWFESGDERARDAVTVRLLVSMIDSIIVHFNGRIPNKISGRSRAMIAVYPGNGTRYVKHVDNPLKDGRCVTSIYYSNENWDVSQHGGVLRLYPETSAVPVDISPLADRLIFFWSDRRNPHEVLPSFRSRFAITTWYFDENEKKAALEKRRQQDEQAKNVLSHSNHSMKAQQSDANVAPKQCTSEVVVIPPEHPPATKFKVHARNASSSFEGQLNSTFSDSVMHGLAEKSSTLKVVIAEESTKLEASGGCKQSCSNTLPFVMFKRTPPA